jgi:hypothetical protein
MKKTTEAIEAVNKKKGAGFTLSRSVEGKSALRLITIYPFN